MADQPTMQRTISPMLVKVVRMLLDFLVILAAFGAGLLCYHALGIGKEDPRILPYVYLALFAGALYVSMFQWMGLYAPRSSSLVIAEVKQLFDAYLYGALILIAVTFFSRLAHSDPPSRLVLLYSLIAGLPMLRLARFGLRGPIARLQANLGDTRDALIVGTNDLARRLHRALERTASPRYTVLGFVSCAKRHIEPEEGPVVGTLDEIEGLLAERSPQAVFVADSMIPHGSMFRLQECCRARGIEFSYVPDLFEFVTQDVKVVELDGIPLMGRRVRGKRRLYCACKRFFDAAFSLVMLIVLSPVFLFVAWRVKRGSAGPVFFRQERAGQGGRGFTLYKFRTMRADAERYAPSPRSSDDPRITPAGRFLRRHSLDELPQLYNVLRGDMSMVGPRPEMPFIVEKYTPAHRIRLEVKPGLTGVWQISAHRADRARSGSEIHDVIDYDLYYVENQSFVLDVLIIAETFFYLLSGRGGC